MREPFAFLDDEEQDDDRTGIAWLPLTLAGLALAGFLAIPILGLFRSDDQRPDWSEYSETDEFEVALNSEDDLDSAADNLEPLLTPDPDDLTDDLTSVDEMLASLGDNYVPAVELADTKKGKEKKGLGVTVNASDNVASKRKPGTAIKRDKVVVIKTSPKRKTTDIPSSSTAKRLPTVQKPKVTAVAGRKAFPTKEVTVKEGDTLYSIARGSGTTPEEIARINGLRPGESIKVGQTLKVPNYDPYAGKTPTIGNGSSYRPVVASPLALPAPAVGPVRNPNIATEPVGPTRAPKIVRPADSTVPSVARPRAVSPTRGGGSPVDTGLFPDGSGGDGPAALPSNDDNPLDAYDNAIAYRVQRFDNLNTISDALATTPEELIKLNGRSKFKKGEMLVVPVDNCLIKDN